MGLRFEKPWFICFTVILLLVSGGCRYHSSKPRLRVGAFFGSPGGMPFPDPNALGRHHYDNPAGEKLGMVYTCRGGFIDIGHVREAADRTAYLSAVTFRNLMLGRRQFTYRVIEPARYRVTLIYPEAWEDSAMEDRQAVAREISVLLGQYFARTSLVWHEIVTWYGFSSTGIFSENISAFSWEDMYSDLLGTRLAVRALQDETQGYDPAMTRLIDEVIHELEVQPANIARKAANAIYGKWYSGGWYFFVEMLERNFDAGLTSGQITPWLVEGICPQAQPHPLPVPDVKFLDEYGFQMELKMEVRELEKHKIYRDLQLDDFDRPLQPEVHFPELLERITHQAAAASREKAPKPIGIAEEAVIQQ